MTVGVTVRVVVLTACLGVIAVALYGIWLGVLSILWHTVGS